LNNDNFATYDGTETSAHNGRKRPFLLLTGGSVWHMLWGHQNPNQVGPPSARRGGRQRGGENGEEEVEEIEGEVEKNYVQNFGLSPPLSRRPPLDQLGR